MSDNNDSWAVVELMGHVTVAGRVTKPGEYGGLWQIDIPEGDTFRTEFFGSQAVYRVRMVSEEIARAYSRPAHEVLEYNAPIITRAEYESAMDKAREAIRHLEHELNTLRNRLVMVQALPAGEVGYSGTHGDAMESWPDSPDDEDDEPEPEPEHPDDCTCNKCMPF